MQATDSKINFLFFAKIKQFHFSGAQARPMFHQTWTHWPDVCNPSQSGRTVTDFDRNLIYQISLRFFNKSLPHIADIHNLCGTTFYGGDRIRPKFGRTHKSRNKIQQLMSHLISKRESVTKYNINGVIWRLKDALPTTLKISHKIEPTGTKKDPKNQREPKRTNKNEKYQKVGRYFRKYLGSSVGGGQLRTCDWQRVGSVNVAPPPQ